MFIKVNKRCSNEKLDTILLNMHQVKYMETTSFLNGGPWTCIYFVDRNSIHVFETLEQLETLLEVKKL